MAKAGKAKQTVGRKRAKSRRKESPPPPPRRGGIFAEADDMRPRIGRPSFKPTDTDRLYVRKMSGVGLSHEEIAIAIGIDRNTLVKHFRQEIDEGRIEANAAVAAALFAKATNKSISGATVRAAEIWLRTRAGWVDAQHPRDPKDEASDREIVTTGGLPVLELTEDPPPEAPATPAQ